MTENVHDNESTSWLANTILIAGDSMKIELTKRDPLRKIEM